MRLGLLVCSPGGALELAVGMKVLLDLEEEKREPLGAEVWGQWYLYGFPRWRSQVRELLQLASTSRNPVLSMEALLYTEVYLYDLVEVVKWSTSVTVLQLLPSQQRE